MLAPTCPGITEKGHRLAFEHFAGFEKVYGKDPNGQKDWNAIEFHVEPNRERSRRSASLDLPLSAGSFCGEEVRLLEGYFGPMILSFFATWKLV